MKLNSVFKLALKDIQRNRKKFSMAGIGIIPGLVILLFFASFGFGIYHAVVDRLLESIPAHELRITRSGYSLESIPLLNNLRFQGTERIQPSTVSNIARIPGVKHVFPQLNIQFPVSIYIDLFGFSFQSDLTVSGVPAGLLSHDNTPLRGLYKHPPDEQDIPALVSQQILDMYNRNFARSNTLPQLSRSALLGRHFILLFGTSSLNPSDRKVERRCTITGYSKRAALLGLTLPIETVEYYNRWYFGQSYTPEYAALFVICHKMSDVQEVRRAVEDMGLAVVSQEQIVERVTMVIFSIIGIFILIGLLVLSVAGISIFNIFSMLLFMQAKELRILRSLGAARADIRNIYLWEAGITGFVSGCAGWAAGWLLIIIGDTIMNGYVPNFPFKPDTFFYTPVWWGCIIIGLGMVFCLTASYSAFRRSCRSGQIL